MYYVPLKCKFILIINNTIVVLCPCFMDIFVWIFYALNVNKVPMLSHVSKFWAMGKYEHLNLTSLIRYARRSKHKKYKYLWQINNTLNIRSQIFSLTSSEKCFFRSFSNPYTYRLKNYWQNVFLSLDVKLNI